MTWQLDIFNGMLHVSCLMRKPTICICENKGADQLRGYAKLISVFVFATRIVQFLYFLNPKFPVSSHRLCLYSPVCVGPVQKQHCWFSHKASCIYSPSVHFCIQASIGQMRLVSTKTEDLGHYLAVTMLTSVVCLN